MIETIKEKEFIYTLNRLWNVNIQWSRALIFFYKVDDLLCLSEKAASRRNQNCPFKTTKRQLGRLDTYSQMQCQQYQVTYGIPYEDEAGNLQNGVVFCVFPCEEINN